MKIKIQTTPQGWGGNFNKEINDIKEARVEEGIDKKKTSTRILSNLLVRHKYWPKIKLEMIAKNLKDER